MAQAAAGRVKTELAFLHWPKPRRPEARLGMLTLLLSGPACVMLTV